ncbi:MAG: hypothetical protein IKP02_08400 [Paludibacteraceae bacterium]|nr:hypothetical protein [Paludibacteraceae bacterium]
MKKSIMVLVALLLAFTPAFAQDSVKVAKKEAAKSHLKQHFKPYGFIRNYFTYDSRESISGTGDLYNYQPKDESWNQTEAQATASGVAREDLNAQSTFRFLSLTTRVGLNIVDYKWRNTEFSGKIEADFFAGLSGTGHKVSGVAQFRLRQAYVALGWDSLPILNGKDYARVDLTIGQTWHPMAADLSDVISLASGAPFGPFNRSPMVKMDARLGKYVTLTAAGLWQMQYMSVGPDGSTAEYMLYGKTPEAYLGLSVHDKGWIARAGVDVLSISPRHQGTVTGKGGWIVNVKVKDRITTISPFAYLQYKKGEFSFKAKTIFAEAGEHMNLDGGYGVSKVNEDGSWNYTPIRNSSTWVSLVYGGKVGAQEDKHPQKLQGILFAGYIQNLGTKKALYDPNGDGLINEKTSDGKSLLYYYTARPNNMNRMWRVSPTLLYTIGKFQIGCEYEITSVQYGDAKQGINASNGLADKGLHWVTNHRVQLMTKYNF